MKEERVPVFSSTFGALAAAEVEALRALGTVVVGTATTVDEARALERSGGDAMTIEVLGAAERLPALDDVAFALHVPRPLGPAARGLGTARRVT